MSKLFLIQIAKSKLSTPGISKSAAAALSSATCCELTDDPIATQSSAHRKPLDIIKGLSKCDLIGCNTLTANALIFSICWGLGLLLIPLRSATCDLVSSSRVMLAEVSSVVIYLNL